MRSQEYRRWDRDHLWHPFCPMQEYVGDEPPLIESARGFWLQDVEGRRYLDGNSSLWCNVHGHQVPELDAAVRKQLERVAHSTLLGLPNEPAVELAHQLVRQSPAGLERVFYSDSGSTAVEVALKMAFQYQRQKPNGDPGRDCFLRLGQAYHGDTLGAVSVGGIDLFHAVYDRLLFETIEVPCPVGLRVPPGETSETYVEWCLDELERLVHRHAHRAVGFVMEPLVQGAAGMLVHPPGFLRRVRELTREAGIPLIVDEVATGFGRTGTMFACEQEGVEPDFLCLAKGISGGYLPLAATLTTREIYEAFLGLPEEGRTFYHGHTYTGNPLACAVGLASLERFESHEVLANAASSAEMLERRLAELDNHPHVAEIRRCGLMAGIELVRDRSTKTPFDPAERVGHRVTRAGWQRGLSTRPLGDVIVLMPAPGMPPETVSDLCDRIFDSIQAVLGGG